MKLPLLISIVLLLSCQTAMPREYEVNGPGGGIAFKLCLPDGFKPESDRCPMVLLMHGIFSSKDLNPMPAIAKGLADKGIASIRFDFNGHGKSQGRMQDMTIERELGDARAIWDYARSLPYVDGIGLLGHSQGGVIASMTAGRLAAEGIDPAGLVLIAPGSIIKEACETGQFFKARFNPQDPPEYITCWGFFKLGRDYLVSTQQLDIFGTASEYKGPVKIIHGTRDEIVPLWCSKKFAETYGDRSEMELVEGETHVINKKRKQVVASVVSFFSSVFVTPSTSSSQSRP